MFLCEDRRIRRRRRLSERLLQRRKILTETLIIFGPIAPKLVKRNVASDADGARGRNNKQSMHLWYVGRVPN